MSAEGEPQTGTEEVVPLTETAPEGGVEPLEAVLTQELVGKLGPHDATIVRELQELGRQGKRIQQEVRKLQQRSRRKVRPHSSPHVSCFIDCTADISVMIAISRYLLSWYQHLNTNSKMVPLSAQQPLPFTCLKIHKPLLF